MPILIRRLLMSVLSVNLSPVVPSSAGTPRRCFTSLLVMPMHPSRSSSSSLRTLQRSALPQWRPGPPFRAAPLHRRPPRQTAGNLRCSIVPSATSVEALQRVQVSINLSSSLLDL